MSYPRVKRGLDLLVGAPALVVSLPVQGLVAGFVRLTLGGPVLFSQERPGKAGKIFRLYKFRTMLEVDEAEGLISNGDRMTPAGAFLRSTSLDELPSLWNVVVGDMSLVGPRPLRTAYLSRYSLHHARRHEVRPGLTGLAQVQGRNALEWDERLDLDVKYVDHMGFRFDLSIIVRTLATVLRREGIAPDGAATMTEFLGSGRDRSHSSETHDTTGEAT